MNDLIPTWAATLLTGFLGILALLYVHRLNTKRAAAATFRAAIDPSVFGDLRGHQLHAALIQVFPRHRAAAVEFRRYLRNIDRLRFNKAWQAYHGGDEECPDWCVMYCLPANGPQLLKERLEGILNAASQT